MKKSVKIAAALGTLLMAGTMLTACQTDADRVSENISTDAEQFKVMRRITFINGITDKNMLTIEGLCSFDPNTEVDALDVTCKVGPGRYVRDSLGLADNVTYLIEQANVNASNVSKYHYKVVLKPENVLPSFDVELGEESGE